MRVWVSTVALFQALTVSARKRREGLPLIAHLKRPGASRDWTGCELTITHHKKRKAGK